MESPSPSHERVRALEERCKQLEQALRLAERRVAQADRVAATSETIGMQSRRSMLKTNARLQQTIGALSEAKQSAEQANLARGRFLATMSHEMRTPLNGMLGTLELIGESRLNAEQNELLGLMRRSTTSLLRLINDILDFSKIEAGRLDLESMPFSLSDCVRSVIDLEAGAARTKGIALEDELDAQLPTVVTGDQLRLRQVLLNLIDNAVKFTQDGHVRLSVRPGGTPNSIEFEVRDTGVGIPESALQDIFDAFTQADASTTRKFGGTGLGLAICKRLVELMGGEIRVQSEVGSGTAFVFTCVLPAAEENLLDESEAPAPSERGRYGVRALVADDNEINRHLAQKMLERLGCEVEVVANGRAACERIAETAFDVVFMDCAMPEMDGFAAAQRIRREGMQTPIVAMTAFAMPEDRARCLDAGMNDYIAKPIKLGSLEATLQRVGFSALASRP